MFTGGVKSCRTIRLRIIPITRRTTTRTTARTATKITTRTAAKTAARTATAATISKRPGAVGK